MAFTTKRSDALSKKKGHKARPCMNLPTNKRKMRKDKKGEIMQSKKTFATRAIAWALAFVMVFTMIPYGAFARGEEPTPAPTKETGAAAALPDNRKPKTNWDEEAGKGDERNWSVDIAGGQRLVRVRTTEPTQITDLNYDGTYTNADGRDVIKLLYKEKTQAISGVWYRMVLKFDSKLLIKLIGMHPTEKELMQNNTNLLMLRAKMRNGLTLA